MINLTKVGNTTFDNFPAWPPVHAFGAEDEKLISALIRTDSEAIRNYCFELRGDEMMHGKAVVLPLSVIYAFFYGYVDSPHINSCEDFESQLVRVKKILEREMIQEIFKLDISDVEQHSWSTEAAIQFLEKLIDANPGIYHPLFDFIQNEISAESMKQFLWFETIRNEVVDDEVAMLLPGTQHAMKQVLSSNLWDECGNGKIDGFHTSWLIRLLTHNNQWESFMEFRKTRPWFSMLTSHSFNSLLTSPGRNFAAYGTFLINESWVVRHFDKILKGMDRLGISSEDVRIYFEAHSKIDDFHTEELLDGIRKMHPQLMPHQLQDILIGALQSIASATTMYRYLLDYFKIKDRS